MKTRQDKIVIIIPILATALFSGPSSVHARSPSGSQVIRAGIRQSLPTQPRKAFRFRIVIDPGHGGNDEGTVFNNGLIRVAEKDVTLLLARNTAKLLRARGYDVVLTRSDDREIPLPARTALANELHADVFLSLHMNSTAAPAAGNAEGIETYILNNTSDASSRRLAHLENSVLGGRTAEDSRKSMDVALILKDLTLDGNLTESKRLACNIQSSLVIATLPQKHNKNPNRGVRQALFHVLLGADMPSVLVEAGFLTSPKDRALVLSMRGQQAIAGAITRAIDEFRVFRGTQEAFATLSRCKVN